MDDFDAVVNNWKVAAEFGKRSGLAGISFDDEVYYGPYLWACKGRGYDKTKTAKQYADQAFLRGTQIMRAINTVYPDIHVLCQYGRSTAYEAISRKPGRLVLDSSSNHALMRAFFDGLLSECTGKARIIDANLASYGWRYGISVDGTPLWTLLSPNEEQFSWLGRSVSGIPDVNGDGRGDVVVGDPHMCIC